MSDNWEYRSSPDADIRLLLLINAFSGGQGSLVGRTKLAKLDFLLRYPAYLKRALTIRKPDAINQLQIDSTSPISDRMIRYRYGPWDPAYFSILGRLISRGLVYTVSTPRGLGYKTTNSGKELCKQLALTAPWEPMAAQATLLKREFNLSGRNLKTFIYENFPEISDATWGTPL